VSRLLRKSCQLLAMSYESFASKTMNHESCELSAISCEPFAKKTMNYESCEPLAMSYELSAVCFENNEQ
jgi:hypothetical protein